MSCDSVVNHSSVLKADICQDEVFVTDNGKQIRIVVSFVIHRQLYRSKGGGAEASIVCVGRRRAAAKMDSQPAAPSLPPSSKNGIAAVFQNLYSKSANLDARRIQTANSSRNFVRLKEGQWIWRKWIWSWRECVLDLTRPCHLRLGLARDITTHGSSSSEQGSKQARKQASTHTLVTSTQQLRHLSPPHPSPFHLRQHQRRIPHLDRVLHRLDDFVSTFPRQGVSLIDDRTAKERCLVRPCWVHDRDDILFATDLSAFSKRPRQTTSAILHNSIFSHYRDRRRHKTPADTAISEPAQGFALILIHY